MAKPQLMVVRPPRVDDPVSIKFMYERLALSGLTPQDVGAYPIDSARAGFTGAFCIPYHDPLMWRTRHDRKVDKYLQPKNRRDVWYAPNTTLEEIRAAETLYIIEGELKAARFLKEWPQSAVLGIGGAWNFLDKTDDGTKRILPAIQECLRPGKLVIAIFDGDILTKPGVQMAATTLQRLLRQYSCSLEIAYPPSNKGVDDWLQETPNASLQDIQFLQFDKLAESRKQLYAVLNCALNEDKLILNELNASKLLAHYFGTDVYNDKRFGIVYQNSRTSIDDFELSCIEYIQGEINPYYKIGAIAKGAVLALRTKHRDLVQETVRAVEWDGIPRLATWGSKYFTTDWPEYANEWGRILMAGLALRILTPGTKVDKVCILAGAQGIGKSTFFEKLSEFGGEQFYFACTSIASSAGDANRTQGMMMSRSTIVDLAEGVVFETKKQTLDTVKQVLTQTHDEYRIPYSKSPTIEPRGYIFVGTTNRYDQLSDTTGSRRYCYLHALKIAHLPYAEKLQILAEVAAQEENIRHSNWWIEEVDLQTAPARYRTEEFEHVTSIQELINTQFTKDDAAIDFIRNLLDSDEVLHLADTGEGYITASFISARIGRDQGDFMNMNFLSRKLSSLMDSPTFPYKLIPQRKRLPQLLGSEQLKLAYMAGITNTQMMVNGYIVRKK